MNLIPKNLTELTRMDAGQWFIDLVRVETRLYNAIDDRVRAAHGLTLGQYQILQLINATPNCRVLDIVRDVAITVGAASKAVDRVEAAGWCRRSANPNDRRSSYLTLTEAGEQVLAAATPTFRAEIASRLAGVLGPDDLARTGALLAALRRALEEQQRPAGDEE
jgi:DNA-binding MarR family transcriptional regulator